MTPPILVRPEEPSPNLATATASPAVLADTSGQFDLAPPAALPSDQPDASATIIEAPKPEDGMPDKAGPENLADFIERMGQEQNGTKPPASEPTRTDGGNLMMQLWSRMERDLELQTGGKRAATFEEIDAAMRNAARATGVSLAPTGSTDPRSEADGIPAAEPASAGATQLVDDPEGRTVSADSNPPRAEAPDQVSRISARPAMEDQQFGTQPAPRLQPAVFGTAAGADNDRRFIKAGTGPGGRVLAQAIPWRGLGEGWRPPLPQISPEKIIRNVKGMAVDQLRRRLTDLQHSGASLAAKTTAMATVTVAINDPFTTPLAARLLMEWRDGTGKTTRDHPEIFGPDSAGSHELLFGDTGEYYRNISDLGIAQLASAGGGKIRPAAPISVLNIPKYDTLDGINGMADGINVGDTIGTFTNGVTAEVRGHNIYFTGRNAMTLGSFSGENTLRHGQVANLEHGRFSNTYQTFVWRVPIPREFDR